MSAEIITKEDLQEFHRQLLSDIKALLQFEQKNYDAGKEWLRSSEVRKLLKISAGTLQNLRISGRLKPSKIGSINFYRQSEIKMMLEGSARR